MDGERISASSAGQLWCRNLSKRYPNGFLAVDDLTLDVRDGEFLTLLGPSGSGKSTTLRMLIGLERPTGGEVGIGDELLSSTSAGVWVGPNDRSFGMVFQAYAVWPHMTVAQNVAFPLRIRRWSRARLKEAVIESLGRVGLTDLADRPVTMLSGGQQQRVAVARALVYSPRVMLFDEPLSSLDAMLRRQMREELRELQTRLKVTTVYVTHDQSEAFSMSDRVALMHDGKVQQVGTPIELYERPRTTFTATFIGSSNIVTGEVTADGRHVRLATTEGSSLVPAPGGLAPGPTTLSIKPERVRVSKAADTPATARGRLERMSYHGDRWELVCSIGPLEVRAFEGSVNGLAQGDAVDVELPTEYLVAIPDSHDEEVQGSEA